MPTLRLVAAAPSGPEPMADPETGAGTGVALRRDVDRDLSGRAPDTAPFVLLRVTVHTAQSGQGLPPDVGLDVIRCLCEIGPFVLRGRDRIYRTGPHEVTVLLAEAGPDGAEAARGRLESATQRAMYDKGHPGVLLAGELVDPATLRDRTHVVASASPHGVASA
jgi:GGDEF domain-containing protein